MNIVRLYEELVEKRVYVEKRILQLTVMAVFAAVFSRLVGRPIAGSQLTRANEVQAGLEVRDVLYRIYFELTYRKEYFELFHSCY